MYVYGEKHTEINVLMLKQYSHNNVQNYTTFTFSLSFSCSTGQCLKKCCEASIVSSSTTDCRTDVSNWTAIVKSLNPASPWRAISTCCGHLLMQPLCLGPKSCLHSKHTASSGSNSSAEAKPFKAAVFNLADKVMPVQVCITVKVLFTKY